MLAKHLNTKLVAFFGGRGGRWLLSKFLKAQCEFSLKRMGHSITQHLLAVLTYKGGIIGACDPKREKDETFGVSLFDKGFYVDLLI